MHCREKKKSLLGFGDIRLIFKVKLTLLNVQNRGSMRYILSQWMDFDQICIDTLFEEWEEFIRF